MRNIAVTACWQLLCRYVYLADDIPLAAGVQQVDAAPLHPPNSGRATSEDVAATDYRSEHGTIG